MLPGYLLHNRYRIENFRSAGRFGKTYLAVDEQDRDKRQVIVKQLPPITTIDWQHIWVRTETIEKPYLATHRIEFKRTRNPIRSEILLCQDAIYL